MATVPPDWHWPDAQRFDEADLAQMCSLTVSELDDLVDYGALVPLEEGATGRQFRASCVAPLREAARLRARHDLDLFTVSLILGYLQRIVHLEQQLRSQQAHLPHLAQLPREGPAPWHEPHA